MKIDWHNMTWYSRALAVLFFVGILPAIGFYFGYQYRNVELTQQTVEISQSEIKPSLQIGTTTLTGFEEFILPEHTLLAHSVGDLNNDGTDDAAIVLTKKLEASEEYGIFVDAPLRPVIILLGSKEGTYTSIDRNDKIAYCETCGGVFGDPFNFIEIASSTLMISNYGGSRDRWNHDYSFVYNSEVEGLILEGFNSSHHDALDPEAESQETVMTQEDFGILLFSEVTPDKLVN